MSLSQMEATNADVMPALHDAAYRGDAETLRRLLTQGADVNAWYVLDVHDAMTALHYACWNVHLECVRVLMEYGADVNADFDPSPGWRGWTPLMCAVDALNGGSDNEEQPDVASIVRLLINNGANVNVRHISTALETAEMSGQKQIAELLRQAGATE